MPHPFKLPPVDWQRLPCIKANTAASILCVTPQHILNMIHDGRLEAIELPQVSKYRRHRDKYRVLTHSLLKVLQQQVKTV